MTRMGTLPLILLQSGVLILKSVYREDADMLGVATTLKKIKITRFYVWGQIQDAVVRMKDFACVSSALFGVGLG